MNNSNTRPYEPATTFALFGLWKPGEKLILASSDHSVICRAMSPTDHNSKLFLGSVLE